MLTAGRSLLAVSVLTASLRAQQGHKIAEIEPNNSAATATLVSLGDTVTAATTTSDVDYFAIEVPAATELEVVGLNRDFCWSVVLLDGDGVTTLAFRSCGTPSTDTLHYAVPASGRYYVRVSRYYIEPHEPEYPALPYTIKFGTYAPPPPGPGNPMTAFASGFSRVEGMAAAPSGDLFIVDQTPEQGARLARVTPDGQLGTFASPVNSAFGAIAIDGFGDLLMPSYVYDDDSGHSHGVVWRYSPTGERSSFATAPLPPSVMFTGVAVGPDGDVWFADPGSPTSSRIWRFDPVGNLKDTINVAATGRAWSVAMSPAGVLHFTNQPGDVYALSGGVAHLVIPVRGSPDYSLWSAPMAFDRDGYLYLVRAGGKVVLFDPEYHAVTDPFLQVLDSLGWSDVAMAASPVFLRAADGSVTARLVVGRFCCPPNQGLPWRSEILETHLAAARAPGARVAPDLSHVGFAAHAPLMLGSAYSDTLRIQNAAPAADWTIIAGRLPPGLTLKAATGVLSGIPADTGFFDFSVRGTSGSRIGYGRFTLAVAGVQLSLADVANAVLGGADLPAALMEFLDLHGNNNRLLDVGDLRALVRAQSQRAAGVVRRHAP
jgi:Putative Ig domain